MDRENSELIGGELTYKINGAALEVYNVLGHGFSEAVYQEALAISMKQRGIPFEKERGLYIYFNGIRLKQYYRADFLCYGRIIVELKAVSRLDSSHENRILHYLKATGLRPGLLYNFGNSNGLEIKRLVFN